MKLLLHTRYSVFTASVKTSPAFFTTKITLGINIIKFFKFYSSTEDKIRLKPKQFNSNQHKQECCSKTNNSKTHPFMHSIKYPFPLVFSCSTPLKQRQIQNKSLIKQL